MRRKLPLRHLFVLRLFLAKAERTESDEPGPSDQELQTVQRNMCELLQTGKDSVTDVGPSLHRLRGADTMHNGETVQAQMKKSFGCEAASGTPQSPALKAVKPTGKSSSCAFQTVDGFFRAKEVLKDEYKFWLTKSQSAFTSHWEKKKLTAMAKSYAFVTSTDAPCESPCKPEKRLARGDRIWVVQRNVFAGIPDFKTDPNAAIYDLKGSDRLCTDKADEPCGKKVEFKEQNFDKNFEELGLFSGYYGEPGHGGKNYIRHGWEDFVGSLNTDVGLLRKLKVHDYSLVMRITSTLSDCPNGFQTETWKESVARWYNAPAWKGAGTEMCALTADRQKSLRIHAVLLDYLQDATTLHNRGARFLTGFGGGGSKIGPSRYAKRFLDFVLTRFFPFGVVEMSAGKDKYNYEFCPGKSASGVPFEQQKSLEQQCRAAAAESL